MKKISKKILALLLCLVTTAMVFTGKPIKAHAFSDEFNHMQELTAYHSQLPEVVIYAKPDKNMKAVGDVGKNVLANWAYSNLKSPTSFQLVEMRIMPFVGTLVYPEMQDSYNLVINDVGTKLVAAGNQDLCQYCIAAQYTAVNSLGVRLKGSLVGFFNTNGTYYLVGDEDKMTDIIQLQLELLSLTCFRYSGQNTYLWN